MRSPYAVCLVQICLREVNLSYVTIPSLLYGHCEFEYQRLGMITLCCPTAALGLEKEFPCQAPHDIGDGTFFHCLNYI